MSQERFEDLNLVPPEGDFELYRYKNAEHMRTSGWSGLYWARKNEQETTRSGPSLRRGKGTHTLGVCSRRSLREILREGRLISAATSSSRSGGTVFHTERGGAYIIKFS